MARVTVNALVATVGILAIALSLRAIRPGDTTLADANRHFIEGRREMAAEWYRRAAGREHWRPVALFNLGVVNAQQGDVPEALGAFENAALLLSGHTVAKARYNRGTLLASRGRNDEALAELRRALLADPSLEDARINYEIVSARLPARKPPAALPSLPQAPEPSYEFNSGRRVTRPMAVDKDW